MEKAVVYARYSSHSQTEQSIEGQLSAARRYASDKGYKIVKEYVDRAKTGTNDNREQFQRMLKDTARHQFSVIIVWKVDRFGRNREEITFNKYKAKKNGVRVEYIAENIAPGPEGVILESVLEGMAEYYSLQLSQNVSRGYLESAKKRHVIGIPPLGYCKDEEKKYKIIPEEAETVRLIYDLYINGSSQSDILSYLKLRHIKNKQGNEFKRHVIHTILNDDRYMGNYRFKGIVLEENCIPQIITKETFMLAQEASKKHLKMNAHNWNYSEYKLSDKLYCDHCGGKLKGSSGNGKLGKKYLYYICPNCKKIHIRADKLDEVVLKHIYNILDNREVLEEISENVYRYYEENDESAKEMERINDLISDNELRTANILKSIEAGLDYNLCKNRLDELKVEKEELEHLKADVELSVPIKITADKILFFLTMFRDDRKDSAIVSSLIAKIIISDTFAEIHLNCTDADISYKCSTAFGQMGTKDCQSNSFTFKICNGYVVFKLFF